MNWVDGDNVALLTDLYELTMLQAYFREGMEGEAVFSLFTRDLPAERNSLVACGLDDALQYLENFRFSESSCSELSPRRAALSGRGERGAPASSRAGRLRAREELPVA